MLKVEGMNLTGSFKDRVMQVLVADAVLRGASGAVVASSGNAAVAASAACAQAGLPLLVLVPEAVSANTVKMVELRGATVVRAGEGPAVVHGLAARLAERFGLANLASTFTAAGCEWACRGIGHEIARQAPEGVTHLVASVSVGPVLVGAGNGVIETGRPSPALIAAQAAGCAPIARAYASRTSEVTPWTESCDTNALAIADRLTGYADQATYTLHRVRESGGFVAAVTDAEMLDMRFDLARYDGLDVELASCAAPAAWRRKTPAAWRRKTPERSVVCILTGSGTKETLGPATDLSEPCSVEQYAERSGVGHELLNEVNEWIHTSRS
jgi:threonine synthase